MEDVFVIFSPELVSFFQVPLLHLALGSLKFYYSSYSVCRLRHRIKVTSYHLHSFSQRFYTSDISRHHAFMGVFGDVKLHLHCDTRLSSRLMFCSVSNFTKCSFRHFYVLTQNPQRDSRLQSPLPVSLFFRSRLPLLLSAGLSSFLPRPVCAAAYTITFMETSFI